ncbi:MAG TPA: sugar kinase [Devosia sp.]|nr:sugar kinase [Devosia sp.]
MPGTILTIGEILVEIMATTPGQGFREPLDLVGPFPSGAPAIFIDQAARLGHPAAIIGCVGNDDFGRLNLDRLRRDGVDVGAVRIDPDAVTGSAFVRYRPDGGRDFVFNIRHSAAAEIRLTDQARAAIEAASHLHVVGSSLFSPALVETILLAAERVKARGGTVSFDPNMRREILTPAGGDALSRILALTDLFLPSGDELLLFAGAADPDAAIRDLLGRGLAAIVHKQGARGARYIAPHADIVLPAFPAAEVDPTGAGDIFGATFVVGWLAGLDPATALRRANAAGALAVRSRGPMEGASSPAAIDAVLAAGPPPAA